MTKRNMTRHIFCCRACLDSRTPALRRTMKRAQRKAERRNLNNTEDE